MFRRIALAVGAGLLLVSTVVLVALAMDTPPPPPAPARPLEAGVVAVNGDHIWRWAGSVSCASTSDLVPLERRVGEGAWLTSPIPLVTIQALHFEDALHGIAIGENARCSRSIAITVDGGRTWRSRDDNPVLSDAWWVRNRVWGIVHESGPPTVQAFTLRGRARLALDSRVNPAFPCDARDGVAAELAFYTETEGLLLCEHPVTSNRLLARTTDGEAFERLTDSRPGSGLAGQGNVDDLDVVEPETAWLQFPGTQKCPGGQLRRSDNQGVSWRRLPCPSKSQPVDKIFDAAFSSPKDGVLFGGLSGKTVLLQTSDGGESWSPLE